MDAEEKMLQHVVPNEKEQGTSNEPTTFDDIDKISTNMDDFQKIPIILHQPYFLLKKLNINLRKIFGDGGPTLNGLFERKIMEWIKEFELEQHVVTLSYRGSFPRKDVLQKLYRLATEFESWPEFPRFKRNHLESIIKTIIGAKDPRTLQSYIDCIIKFVETKNGSRISFYGDYDISDFKKTVEEALTRIDKGDLE